MVTNLKKVSSFATEHVIAGPRAEVEAAIEEVFARYPTAGYGTKVKHSVEKEGVMRATVWRANSCD